jgi:hypothetical protein
MCLGPNVDPKTYQLSHAFHRLYDQGIRLWRKWEQSIGRTCTYLRQMADAWPIDASLWRVTTDQR